MLLLCRYVVVVVVVACYRCVLSAVVDLTACRCCVREVLCRWILPVGMAIKININPFYKCCVAFIFEVFLIRSKVVMPIEKMLQDIKKQRAGRMV